VFSAHLAILAQGECIAQVLHSFHAVKPRLGVGVAPTFKTVQDRQPCPLRKYFGEDVRLVESAFSQSGRVKRHGDEAIRWIYLYSHVLHGFDQILREHPAQIKLAIVLETVDQISQDTLCLIVGHRAIKGRPAILAVRAGEFFRDETFEGSGTTAAVWWSERR
jgi:hypothetical protein